MRILDKNWLTQPPFDYELKIYKLLAAVKLMRAEMNVGVLFPVLSEIESHLEELYIIKYNKDIIDDRLKVLKGINLDTMSLEYEYPEHDQAVSDMYDLCDKSIVLFEEAYKDLRAIWRNVERAVTITEIPDIRKTFKEGYVFIIVEKSKMYLCEFKIPFVINENWKNFNLEMIESFDKYDIRYMTEFIEDKDKIGNFRFFRCDFKKHFPLEETMIPVSKMILFNKVKLG